MHFVYLATDVLSLLTDNITIEMWIKSKVIKSNLRLFQNNISDLFIF